MQGQGPETRQSPLTSRARHAGIRSAVIVALTLLCSVVLPVIPIFLGLFLIVAVALHVWSPDLQPYVQPLLRVPVARASKRRARLLLTACAGILLMVSGSVGATMRGQLRGEREQRERQRELAEAHVSALLERAMDHLSKGNVGGAELELLDADAIVAIDPERQEEVDGLLERLRRSGDRKAILDILTQLPQKEFEAFERGTSVPEALEFGEHALTVRAVELARAQLEEAQQVRARR